MYRDASFSFGRFPPPGARFEAWVQALGPLRTSSSGRDDEVLLEASYGEGPIGAFRQRCRNAFSYIRTAARMFVVGSFGRRGPGTFLLE